jgi:hypothetical protein
MVPISLANHYQYWTIHYAGEALQLHCDASVHVEDFDDAVFWERTFNHYTVFQKKFNFIYHSLTPSGRDATGVNHCLEYAPYLNKQFFVCIDSDYRYLMQESGIDPNHFVLQTYTYSIENHYSYFDGLNEVCKKATGLENTIFDFEAFLLSYSHALYEALIWHLYFVKNDEVKFSKADFTRIISLQQCVVDYDISHNAQAVTEELSKRCLAKVQQLTIEHPEIDIEKTKTYYETLGLHQDNAYLYVRGHNLYDLVCAIGNAIDEKLLSMEKLKLNGNNKTIKKLYSQKVSFEVALLQHIIFDVYPETQKIGQDISAFFEIKTSESDESKL